MKIGIGIITCNRPEFLKKLWATMPDYIDDIVIVNDGNKIDNIEGAHIINNPKKNTSWWIKKCRDEISYRTKM